jgi:multiple sugar transport system substrate-binding protein
MTAMITGPHALSRRSALKALAAVTAAMALPGSRLLAQERTTLEWWDIYQPLIPLHEAMWAEYAAGNQVDVNYTGMNPSDMMQAVQLAYRANQAPDVQSVPNDPATVASLQAAGWFQPLAPSFSFDKPFQQQALAEGFSMFGGEVYSFPTFSFRQSSTSLWYFNELMAGLGIDPEAGPGNWDAIRQAAKALTGGQRYGLLLPLQFVVRMADHLTDLAQAAGAPGQVDWRTGDYAFASDGFVEALEWLLSFQQDGSLHPASSSLDARQGRARWVAGEAAMFFDGPWNSGVLQNSFAEQIDTIGAQRTPYPDTAESSFTARRPTVGTFFISSQCENPQAATDVLQLMTSDEYYVALAERMDQPPLNLGVVDTANVHPVYRKVVNSFSDYVRLAPDPLVRNPDVSKVYAEMRPITPGLGEIIQGAFAGAFSDVRPALQQLSDQMAAERDRAIGVANAAGASVSVGDWVFEDWAPASDYTTAS